MSMDPAIGDFGKADVLVDGKKIVAVGPNLQKGRWHPRAATKRGRGARSAVIPRKRGSSTQ
jgi:hypothetical protein